MDGVAADALEGYRQGLSPAALDGVIEELCHWRQRCEWLLCRYLADIAEADRFRALGWYSDVLHYARHRFGLGVKVTRERVRVGRALRELGQIEAAFVDGRLSYSAVRELSRVATAADESWWLEQAVALPMRQLERLVAGLLGAAAPEDRGVEAHWVAPEVVELRLQLPTESWALLARAIEGARLASEQSLSDAEALTAVAREALCGFERAAGGEAGSDTAVDAADPRRAVVLYHCKDCARTELETTAGAVEIAAPAAAALGCGARVIDLGTEGRGGGRGGAVPASIRRAVTARDRGRCRNPSCGCRRFVDLHHIVPVSEGGRHGRSNCLLLWSRCHAALHAGQLGLRGDAEGELCWLGAEGQVVAVEQWSRGSGARRGGANDATPQLGPRAEAGSSGGAEGASPQLGPRADDGRDGGSPRPGHADAATTILAVMGSRGGWHLDRLVEETGLGVSKIATALTMLEIDGVVRNELGLYAATGAG